MKNLSRSKGSAKTGDLLSDQEGDHRFDSGATVANAGKASSLSRLDIA
ncbi:hypothetical protein [Methylobacterium sp. W2]|nr:hypothetical protein [Methylobacterium sp. W2]